MRPTLIELSFQINFRLGIDNVTLTLFYDDSR